MPTSVCCGFVAFLWQIPPFRPVLPVLPSNILFAVNNLALARHLHTVEVVGSNPAVPTILSNPKLNPAICLISPGSVYRAYLPPVATVTIQLTDFCDVTQTTVKDLPWNC